MSEHADDCRGAPCKRPVMTSATYPAQTCRERAQVEAEALAASKRPHVRIGPPACGNCLRPLELTPEHADARLRQARAAGVVCPILVCAKCFAENKQHGDAILEMLSGKST